MSATYDEGVALFCDRPASSVASAFDAITHELGYARTEDPRGVEVVVAAGLGGVGIRIPGTKSFGLALGRRLARKLARPVRVFSTRVVGEGSDFECVLDDLRVAVDGSTTQGPWAAETTSQYDGHWSDASDGKAYFAVSVLLGAAIADLLGEEMTERRHRLLPPPSLGAPRLDQIAEQARLGERVQLSLVAGRACVRITNAGATVTSFVSEGEATILREALGALLGG